MAHRTQDPDSLTLGLDLQTPQEQSFRGHEASLATNWASTEKNITQFFSIPAKALLLLWKTKLNLYLYFS